MKRRVVVLGAGFGGLELCTLLAQQVPDEVELTLIDQNDGFTFGFAKFDILFGVRSPEEVRLPYAQLAQPGVDFRQETIVSIDPIARRVITDGATYDADILVVALGADYDQGATPGLFGGGHEFYSLGGVQRLRDALPGFERGRILLAVLSIPFKCPPAPYEGILLLHDYLVERGIRDDCQLHVITPQPSPIPVSPQASAAVEKAMAERGIEYTKHHRVYGIDPVVKVAHLKDHDEPFDLFIGVPVHKAPEVLQGSGLLEDGWIRVDPLTLATRFPGVYALGDCAESGVPKAGVFAESAAVAVAGQVIAQLRGGEAGPFRGTGSCYLELGGGEVARVDVDLRAPGGPTAPIFGPGAEYAADKAAFGADRQARWFGG